MLDKCGEGNKNKTNGDWMGGDQIMAKKGKIKFVNFASQNYEVVITEDMTTSKLWYIRCLLSLSETDFSYDMEEYRRLKRIWRKAKGSRANSNANFDDECKKKQFRNLFNYQDEK